VAFDRRMGREVQGLFAASKGRSRLVTEADLVGLPEPVQRWLRWSNVLGTAYPVTVRLRQEGEFRLDQGALLRFLTETMWFPAGVLTPSIMWEPRDATSAVATMRYGGVSAAATFIFDDQGRLTNMTAERFDNANKAILPWSTPISDYGQFAGIRVPVQGAGVWHYEQGEFPYIRLRVTDLEYNRPEPYRRRGRRRGRASSHIAAATTPAVRQG
jgi:hypothetical protein